MLLALAAAVPVFVALTAELVFVCAGSRGVFLRPGQVGVGVRKVQRTVEKQVPWLSGFAALASVGLALSAGPMTPAGCLALGGVLALVAHLTFCMQFARRFHDDTMCLERPSTSGTDLRALQTRWEVEMTTRASLHAAALACIVGSMLVRL